MRITDGMMSGSLLFNLEAVQDRLNTSQNELSTGRRINKPSDDPIGTGTDMRIRNTMDTMDEWSRNISDALSEMNASEGALNNLTGVLQRARTLVVQGLNGTYTQDALNGIAANIDQITQQASQIGDTKLGDVYVFSGTETQTPLSSFPTATPAAVAGFNSNVNYMIGQGVTIPVNVKGSDVFYNSITNASGATVQGLMSTLASTSADLKAGNMANLQNDLSAIDDHLNHMLDIRADLGARVNRMDALQQQTASTQMSLKQQLGDVQDADLAQVITQLRLQQTAYQAALQTGAQIIPPSLIDYLK